MIVTSTMHHAFGRGDPEGQLSTVVGIVGGIEVVHGRGVLANCIVLCFSQYRTSEGSPH